MVDKTAQDKPIVYLDECGFKAFDHRPYGYSTKGEVCHGSDNWHLKNQSNAIGAIINGELFALRLYDGSINSDIFSHWVREALLPELPKNSVIVMDNAAFHKRSDIQAIIEEHGHEIVWLPPYSPDLNPIEKMWAWIKQIRKEWRMDCIDTLCFYLLWIGLGFR
ncbi:IS630 family transposase [Suttonella ornithocola]|uniref:IS630 family transposase n=1 Tax=Suttonella ornithocola TaxID=279832 RepID=UPI001FE8894C|nr:IS630 family transposase [Suttonella ornithocola]